MSGEDHKIQKNRLSARPPLRTPLGELPALPQISLLVGRGLAAPSPRTVPAPYQPFWLQSLALRASDGKTPLTPISASPLFFSTTRTLINGHLDADVSQLNRLHETDKTEQVAAVLTAKGRIAAVIY